MPSCRRPATPATTRARPSTWARRPHPVLQARPPDSRSNPAPSQSQATGDCSLCHNTTVWTTPTTLPNGHMPIPGTQTCTVCHLGTLTADPTSYATLAAIAVLHTGITTGCAQCHGGATPLTFSNNNHNPKAAGLSPTHIPAFTGDDCSACHTTNYVAGGFGPMNMTQATHAGVGDDLHDLPRGRLSASTWARQARACRAVRPITPPARWWRRTTAACCHTTANWNQHRPAGGPHAESGQPDVQRLPHGARRRITRCSRRIRSCTPASPATARSATAPRTQLSFYNNDMVVKDGVLAPSHIPYLAGDRLQLLPFVRPRTRSAPSGR